MQETSQIFVPVMSQTAVEYIVRAMMSRDHAGKERFIVEYGSGYSTKYFIDLLRRENIRTTYIAVERHPNWFTEMLGQFPGGVLVKNNRSIKDYVAFARSKPQNTWAVPEECGRLKKQQQRMLAPRSLLKFLLSKNSFWYDAKYAVALGSAALEYYYIYEGFKDQFGESPNKHKYIHEPLASLLAALQTGKARRAVFMIDGGPRADVVKEIFALIDTYKNLTADIFLLEAYRGFYKDILSSRPGGRFVPAEKNELVGGGEYLKEPNAHKQKSGSCADLFEPASLQYALERELWHFQAS